MSSPQRAVLEHRRIRVLASILAWSLFAGSAAVSSPTVTHERAARRDSRTERRRRLSVPSC